MFAVNYATIDDLDAERDDPSMLDCVADLAEPRVLSVLFQTRESALQFGLDVLKENMRDIAKDHDGDPEQVALCEERIEQFKITNNQSGDLVVYIGDDLYAVISTIELTLYVPAID